jgi:hypothetical protein
VLRPTVSRQSFLVSSRHLAPKTRFLLLSDICGFVDVGRPLWREDWCVIYNCYWSSLAQSFLGPIPAGLVTIFYSDSRLPKPGGPGPRIYIPPEQDGPVIYPLALGSIFVASYDSQSYGGCIGTRFHAGMTTFPVGLRSIASAQTFPAVPVLFHVDLIAAETCLPCRCLAIAVSFSNIPPFSLHVTILNYLVV